MLQYKNVKLQLEKKVILKTNNIIVRYIMDYRKSSSFENIFTELLEKLNLKIAMLG